MNKKIMDFLSRIKKEKPEEYILFRKLYESPSKILIYGLDQIDKGMFCDYHLVHGLILNNDFLEFMDIVLDDIAYLDKLNYSNLEALRCIISDSESFAEKISTKDIFRYSIKNLQNLKFSKSFRDSLQIYIDEYKTRKDLYNMELSSKITKKMLEPLNDKEDYEIRPLRERDKLYDRILNDDYNEPSTCAICISEATNSKILNAFVCDNRFLEIIKNVFLYKRLKREIIDKLIDILKLSIVIYEESCHGATQHIYYGHIVKKEKVCKYNIEEAKRLLSILKNLVPEENNKHLVHSPFRIIK